MPRISRIPLMLLILGLLGSHSLTAQGRGGSGMGGAGGGRAGRGGTTTSARGRQGNTRQQAPVTNPRIRLASITKAIASLDSAIAQTAPTDLTKAEHTEWDGETNWLTTTRNQLDQFEKKLSALVKSAAATNTSADSTKNTGLITPPNSNPDAQKLAQMNTQFITMQKKIVDEANRRYQTLSNASKARHDIAMNAIRNLR